MKKGIAILIAVLAVIGIITGLLISRRRLKTNSP